MRSLSLTSALLLFTLGGSAPLFAEVLEMQQTGPTTPVPAGMAIPVRGMHMQQVEQMYGKPKSIEAPVGKPPITRWDYADYTVYFEYSYVIQSVVKR
ncbi:MAG: hypothetical protein OQL08_09940 [Gammaproteobacteria bacterium]|nr:hypothetical protein [Gammaproteobacteria bacterium]